MDVEVKQRSGSGWTEVLTRFDWSKTAFFVAAGVSFLLSVALWFGGDRERGLFVGLWVPSILAAGGLLHAGEQRHE